MSAKSTTKKTAQKEEAKTCPYHHKMGLVLAMIILAFGIGFAGIQIHEGLTNFKSFDRSVQVKGLAQRDVMADLALWPIAYTETGNDLAALQDLMDLRGELIFVFSIQAWH